MPELPEVETVRRSLEPIMRGATIAGVDIRHPRLARRNSSVDEVVRRLVGRQVVVFWRHGKFLLAALDSGSVWVTHLGMSGHIRIAQPDDPQEPHTHVIIRTASRADVRMVDPRTFGFIAVLTQEERGHSSLARLGPDAWTDLPRTPRLWSGLEGRRVPIKARLLDQTWLAGLGNIYADEILHRAKIRPTRPAGSLHWEEVLALRASIRPILAAGIRFGGTSLDALAYLRPDGAAGRYLQRLRVYDREGRPCRRCGGAIIRTVVGGRSSYYCPSCQI